MKIISSEYQINNSDVAPDATTVNLGTKNALFGVGHNLSALATHDIIAGEGHIVTDTEDASHQAIFGYANQVKDNYGGMVVGSENIISSTLGTIYNYLFGSNVQVTAGGGWNFIFGNGTQVSSDGVISLGGSSNIYTMDYAIGFGRSLDIQKTTTEIGGVAIGNSINIRGNFSYGLGLNIATAVEAEYSFAMGWQAYTRYYGQHAQASGFFAQQGDAQTSVMTMRKQTTDAVATELAFDGGVKYLQTVDNHSYIIKSYWIARDAASSDSLCFEYTNAFERGVGAATLTKFANQVDLLTIDAGLTGIVLDVLAMADGHIQFKCQGLAGKTINWVARIEMTEVKV